MLARRDANIITVYATIVRITIVVWEHFHNIRCTSCIECSLANNLNMKRDAVANNL